MQQRWALLAELLGCGMTALGDRASRLRLARGTVLCFLLARANGSSSESELLPLALAQRKKIKVPAKAVIPQPKIFC